MALGIGKGMELGAVDGVVLADIDVIGILGNVQIGAVRDIGKGLVFGRSHLDSFTVFAGFLPCLLGPLARYDVGCLLILHQVHGNGCELGPCAALQEQDLVIVGDLKQVSQVSFGFLDDAVIDFAAMAHFHDRHAASAVVKHFVRSFLQNFNGKHSRSCRKIINTCHLIVPPWMCSSLFIPYNVFAPVFQVPL